MGLHTDWVQYGENGLYSGYLARPDRVEEGLPAVVVIQEIWGVDPHIQDVAERYAKAGYVAFAPDLYARGGQREPGLEAERVQAVKSFLETVPPSVWNNPDDRDRAIDELPEPSRTEIRTTFAQLFGGLNLEKHLPQLHSTTEFLRNSLEASKNQAVVSVGFCMGGGLSVRLAATDSKLNGAVIFYGHAPSDEQIEVINCPVRGFYGELDPRISDAVPDFSERMKKAGKDFDYQIYDGAHHAFFNDTRASYNVKASRDAFSKVLAFLDDVTSK